jgi:hypothetical protein
VRQRRVGQNNPTKLGQGIKAADRRMLDVDVDGNVPVGPAVGVPSNARGQRRNQSAIVASSVAAP